MKNQKGIKIIGIFLGLIIILGLLYYSTEKNKINALTKAVENKNCTSPRKLCVYTKHKYFDERLQIKILLFPGNYYFLDKDFKEPTKYDYSSTTYSLNENIVDNWVSSINGKDTYISLEFEDKDGFLIETKKITLNGLYKRTRKVNSDGAAYGLEFSTSFKISEESYRRISDIDLTWQTNLTSLLPD